MTTLDAINQAIAQNTERPPSGINDLIIAVHGEKKVGKSTFATRFERPFFLDCEDALRTVTMADGSRPRQISITHWDVPDDASDSAKATSIRFWPRFLATPEGKQLGIKTLVVDGGGQMYKRAVDHVLRANNVADLNEGPLAYGKGNRAVRKEIESFMFELRKLTYQGYGVIILAHSRTVEFDHNGAKFDKRVPLIDGEKDEKAWDVIKPSVDMVIYAFKQRTADGIVHFMQLKGNEMIEAADPTPDGRLPEQWVFSQPELVKLYAGTVEAAEGQAPVPPSVPAESVTVASEEKPSVQPASV